MALALDIAATFAEKNGMTHTIKIFLHNDLFNLAFYHLCTINDKSDRRERDALSLDCMSYFIAISFGVEAFINSVGKLKVSGWRERQPFKAKIDQIYKEIGGNFVEEVEPYTTIATLKELRDCMAHGKPIEKSVDVSTRDELWVEMDAPWAHCLTPEYVNHTYEQVKIWREDLLRLARISAVQILTSAR